MKIRLAALMVLISVGFVQSQADASMTFRGKAEGVSKCKRCVQRHAAAQQARRQASIEAKSICELNKGSLTEVWVESDATCTQHGNTEITLWTECSILFMAVCD
jgi:hypothetical protein